MGLSKSYWVWKRLYLGGDLASAHSEKFYPIEDIINACKVYVYTILDICG